MRRLGLEQDAGFATSSLPSRRPRTGGRSTLRPPTSVSAGSSSATRRENLSGNIADGPPPKAPARWPRDELARRGPIPRPGTHASRSDIERELRRTRPRTARREHPAPGARAEVFDLPPARRVDDLEIAGQEHRAVRDGRRERVGERHQMFGFDPSRRHETSPVEAGSTHPITMPDVAR
jgi:hypothetical protein